MPWITLVAVLIALVPLAVEGAAEGLQYDRTLVDAGSCWRLFTGQLVHWTPRMAAADLLIVVLAGMWVEMRSRTLFVTTVLACLVTTGLWVHLWESGLALYRGSSGVGSGLFVVTCVGVARDGDRPRWIRGAAVGALILLAAKIVWEATGGHAVAAGELPPGTGVATSVHVVGAVTGALCYWGSERCSRGELG